MVKCCKTCIFFAHQVIENKIYSDGKCMHIAFIRAGMSRMVNKENWVLLGKDVNSITCGEIKEANKEGYIFYDFVKVLGHRLKTCDHWISQLSFANIVFKYYNDDIRNYRMLKGSFEKWFENKCTSENKKLKQIEKNRTENKTYVIKEVPEAYLKYDSCATCVFFRYTIKDGTIEPFKGVCSENTKSEDNLSVFKRSKKKERETYNFLSCKKHKAVDMNVFIMADKLKYFIETNPIVYEIDEIKNIYRHPFITRMVKTSIENIQDVDLNKLLYKRYDNNEWEKFKSLKRFKVIKDSFRKNLKRCKGVQKDYSDSDKMFE